MTETEFIERWSLERPCYTAWGFFVRDEIQRVLRETLNLDVATFVKIPATPRLKDENSLLGKAFHRSKGYQDPYLEIEDKVGLRFVVLLTDDIRKISDAVETSPHWSSSLDKDFQADQEKRPLEFAYQSKHYVVKAKQDMSVSGIVVTAGTPCEIQIRTLLQHAHSELTHDNIYKRDSNATVSKKVERTVAKSMALIEAVDDFFTQVLVELEHANGAERSALLVLQELYRHFVGKEPLVDKTSALVLCAFKSELGADLTAQLATFLGKNSFVGKNINSRFDKQYIFRQPWILLVYLLVSTKHNYVREHWPLTLHEIEPVFTDLGKSIQ
jgi:ppGpp synthetase/RelA/SpoT-type nucleotidyltranferase